MPLQEKIENLATKATELVETGYKLSQAKTVQKISQAASAIMFISVMLLLFCFLLLFLGLALAQVLGQLFHSITYGYAIVGGVYLLVIFILFAIRKSVILPFFRNIVVKKIYE